MSRGARSSVLGLLLAIGAVVAVPALGADETIRATESDTFEPARVTVTAGDTVTFMNEGGLHNVVFEDGENPRPEPSREPWTARRTFGDDHAGETLRFRCTVHSADFADGMVGAIEVQAAPVASPTPSPTATPSATPAPSPESSPAPAPEPTPPPGDVGSDPAAPAPAPAPVLPPAGTAPAAAPRLTAAVLRTRVCARRSPDCRRPGVRLRLSVEPPTVVMGTLYRRPLRGGRERRYGTVRFRARAGRHRVAFVETRAGRRLRPGRYRLVLRATGAPATTVRFTVLQP